MYDFRGARAWYDVRLPALLHVGWRPDCVVADSLNMDRCPPPMANQGETIDGLRAATVAAVSRASDSYRQWEDWGGRGSAGDCRSVFSAKCGLRSARACSTTGAISACAWSLGHDQWSRHLPTFVLGAGLPHALQSAEASPHCGC